MPEAHPVQVRAPTPPETKPTGITGPNKGPAAGFVVVVTAICCLLLPDEGRELKVYRDSAGIPTICMGLIEPRLINRHPGVDWTKAECKVEEEAYVAKMVGAMAPCLGNEARDTLTEGEWIWHGHFAYNVGTRAWCRSSAPPKLNRGDHEGACKVFAAYTWITTGPRTPPRGENKPVRDATGKLIAYRVQCRDPLNRCTGLPKRRDREVEGCLDAL